MSSGAEDNTRASWAQNEGTSNTFATRSRGQKKVKEFLKYVHPDFFANAPEKIREVNSANVQELNEHLQALRLFTDLKGAPGRTLQFYIKNPAAAQDEGPQSESAFIPLSYEITELKDGCSADLKQQHYLTVVEGLSAALHSVLDDAEF